MTDIMGGSTPIVHIASGIHLPYLSLIEPIRGQNKNDKIPCVANVIPSIL